MVSLKRESGLQRRARRALERQLVYQRRKAAAVAACDEHEILEAGASHARDVRGKLEAVRPISADARVLEVGCGSTGLIFFFGARDGVGVDPLADHYAKLFPTVQSRAKTIAAPGEDLPLEDASFDIVLCDNVVDHAENPRKIVEEISRVLAPGGMLYFEVNIHHPVYHYMSLAHAAWRRLGVPLEIAAFSDHTVHLTRPAARGLFDGLPLEIVTETDDITDVKQRTQGAGRPRAGDWAKRLFFKNARFEVVAIRKDR